VIVDTSALMAILRDEPDADSYATALATADNPRISAATYLETAIVIDMSRIRSPAVTSTNWSPMAGWTSRRSPRSRH
jgi:uncharacterized protein with PIN domain